MTKLQDQALGTLLGLVLWLGFTLLWLQLTVPFRNWLHRKIGSGYARMWRTPLQVWDDYKSSPVKGWRRWQNKRVEG